MRKKITLLTFFVLNMTISFSQNSVQRRYVSPATNFQFSLMCLDTAIGGYALAGFNYLDNCSENTNIAPCVIMTGSSGIPVWSYNYSFCNQVYCYDIKSTVGQSEGILGGIIIAGEFATNLLASEYPFLLKLSPTGDILWAKRISNIQGYYNCITVTNDSGYFSCGSENGNSLLSKWDINGNLQWSMGYGNTGSRAYRAYQLRDNGYIISGRARQGSTDRPYVLRTDSNGNLIWYREFVLISTNNDAYTLDMTLSSDSGYVISGYGPFGKGFLLKIDKAGTFLWAKRYSIPNSSLLQGLVETPDKGFFIIGKYAGGSSLGHSSFIMKVDSLGNHIWNKIFMDSIFYPYKIIRKDFIHYSFVTNHELQPFHYNACVLFDTLGIPACIDTSLHCNVETINPTIFSSISPHLLNLSTATLAVYKDSFNVIVYDGCSNQVLSWNNIPNSTANEISERNDYEISLSPNPVTSELRIQNAELKIEHVEIYNVLGEKRLTLNPSPKGEGLRVDVSSLASGIYFVKVKGEKEERVAKFVKQ